MDLFVVDDVRANDQRSRGGASGRRAFGKRIDGRGGADLLRRSGRSYQRGAHREDEETALVLHREPQNLKVGPAMTDRSCIVNAATFERSLRYCTTVASINRFQIG